MQLNQIQDNNGARKNRIRVGRGIGSGKGKTCGRGHKGQKSRSGVSTLGLEGGQTPIFMRLPKRGFNNPFATPTEIVKISTLNDFAARKKIAASKVVDIALLRELGIINKQNTIVKLVGNEEATAKFNLQINKASKGALASIEKAGGKVELVEFKAPAKKAQEANKDKKVGKKAKAAKIAKAKK